MLGVTSVHPTVSDGTCDETVGAGDAHSDAQDNTPGDATAEPWPPPTPTTDAWQPVPRAGELNAVWRSVLAACWIGVFFVFAAVWKASEEIGIATWWLGPRSAPQPLLIRLLPFILALCVALVVISNLRQAVWVSYSGAAVIAVLAALDLSRSAGLAVIEFAIAAAVVLVTTASFAGRYKVAPRQTSPGDAGIEGAPHR